MTVCIAAIADNNTLIGVSDRMLTAADGQIEFETGQVKAWQFSTSIIALVSGDISIQAEILSQVDKEVTAWINDDPKTWVNVKAVARLYCQKLRELRRERAEAEILHPLGLDVPSFLINQASMHSDVVANIAERLTTFDFPSVLETILMGIDNDGSVSNFNYKQLYVTSCDKLSWLSTVGFAAIGIGKSHAESQFMFSGHWPAKAFDETLLLAYAAKKRAEAAPGVGGETNIVVIGPGLGRIHAVEEKHMKELDGIYQESRKASARAIKAAQTKTKEFVKRIREEYQQQAKDHEESESAL